MKIDLADKIALVTGGARGIGRETSLVLAEAGATVIINYKKSSEKAEAVSNAISERGGACCIFQADVSDPQETTRLFDHIRDKYGKIDILVNNAGVIKDNLLLSMRLSEWDAVIDTNLKGAFLCAQKAAEMMIVRHSGKIINMSSIASQKAVRGQSNYAASKGGLVSFTRACAVELAGKGIQVNAVLPGLIQTDMTRRTIKRAGDKIDGMIPAGRIGTPSDVANLIVFLVSDKADYITGQAILVDGGMSVS